ncbi:MAG TPA: copper amine oxidase N-terminal domain-containing protein [Caldisericia bacterium]|nr:copper amine oxidase N-terminal domain-containing protein [Caldisericia bacterium]HPF49715.1 copper amine oxidase N-terminal domain-containing protein [Caldisericia bacterium]HPI84576.1 copper amine oxidase N-terminal domain-containing protein [Caldisericia bacterium]HPQ93412.1 copper amine oxidase N-terminal domain-containing protein [Caldisericia bacterium]HRV74872.1 copper amine oxidase N-terminal domain-containing protein [Caldisericia bacterium]
MKRFVAPLLAAVFFFAGVSVSKAVCKVDVYSVDVNPAVSLAKACYTVSFHIECAMVEGETFEVHLPRDSETPYGCRTCDVNIDGDYKHRYDVEGNVVRIQLTRGLSAGRHYFHICNVTNPSSKGPHVVSIVSSAGVFTSRPFNFADTAISIPKVEVNPDYVKACAEYEITFKTSSDASTGCGCSRRTVIYVTFPKNFVFPYDIDPQFVLVNGRPADSVGIIDKTLVITSSSKFVAGQTIKIKILKGAGVINPETPGWYSLNVYTSDDRISINSERFYIRPSTVTRAKVTLDDPYTCSKSGFVVEFMTGPYGQIKKGSKIELILPPSFDVPDFIPAENLSVNDMPVMSESSIKSNNIDGWSQIAVLSPVDIGSESKVVIIVLPGAMIALPDTPSYDYSIDVRTATEPNRVPSLPFSVDRSRLRNVKLTATPSYVSLPAVIQVAFRLGGCGDLTSGIDTITVQFDELFWFPDSKLMTDIKINGVPVDRLVMVSGKQITISPPNDIPGDEWVTVEFGEGCGIRNPSKAGEPQKVKVWTTRERDASVSNIILFATTKISGVAVSLSKPQTGKYSSCDITFVSGSAGALKAGSQLLLRFPEGFDFKGPVSTHTILVNETRCRRVRLTENTLELTTGLDIEAGTQVGVSVSSDANLRLPDEPSYYQIEVATEAEPEFVLSQRFPIADKIQFEYKVTPDEPDGIDEWYVTHPTVELRAFNSLDEFAQIELDINFDVRPYNGSFEIDDGFTVIKAVATDKFGNVSEPLVLSFDVDTNPPTFEPESGTVYSRAMYHSEIVEIDELNDVEIEYDETEGVTVERQRVAELVKVSCKVETEQTKTVEITATDEAGNSNTWERIVVFDWTEPMLELPDRITTDESEITISGKTESGASVVCDDEIIICDDEGNFTHTVSVSDGFSRFFFTAKDRAGNSSTKVLAVEANLQIVVVLTIGETAATINDVPTEIGSNPVYLSSGNAMIPLRFLAEAFDADVGWDEKTSEITITVGDKVIVVRVGNRIAIVDGEVVEMPVTPEIKSGATFVPLRFITESFGCQLEVVGKKITITYNK